MQRPLAVPADGGPHKTSIGRFDLDAALDHLAVPVLAPEAYLRATVTNTSPLLLLPGPARVFHGTQFVGETSLETVAAGEEFELQLGVDDQIRVERKLRRRSTGKAVIGGTRTIDVGYEITVENHRTGKTAGQRARPHPGVHRRRHQGPAPGDEPGPGHADRPGRAHLGALARRRPGGDGQVPVHRRAPGPGHGDRDLTATAMTDQAVWRRACPSGQVLDLLHARVTEPYAPHVHEEYAVGACTAGREVIRYRGTLHYAGPGSVVVLEPGEAHTGAPAVPRTSPTG